LRHRTEVSGSTLFVSCPDVLPLADLPILGSISSTSTDTEIGTVLELVRCSSRGGSLRVLPVGPNAESVRTLGRRLARILRECSFPNGHPLVLLMRENLGKVLGQYVTEWGTLPLTLLVIDEVPVRTAQYVHVGRLHDKVLPVSFYGLNEPGDAP
jgi:ethanolamine utilization protein EutA